MCGVYLCVCDLSSFYHKTDSEAFDQQAPSLLQWFGAHQVVLQSLAEEDHSVRSTGVAVLCLLAHKKTVLVEFCTTQSVGEVS